MTLPTTYVEGQPGHLDDHAEIASTLVSHSSTLGGLSSIYQGASAELTALAAVTGASFGRSLVALVDAAALRTAGGLVIGTNVQAYNAGLAAIAAQTTAAYGRSVLDTANAVALRVLAGLVIGTDVQAYNVNLAALAGLTSAANKIAYFTGSGTAAVTDFTSIARTLLAGVDAPAMRSTLSVDVAGTAAGLVATETTNRNTAIAALSSVYAPIGATGAVAIVQTAHGLSVANVIRMSSTNYVKAQADSAANAEVVGVVSAVADANNFTFIPNGLISTLSGLTAGTVYFLSPSTAGLLTATEPTTSGQISKPVLIASTTTAGYVKDLRGRVVT